MLSLYVITIHDSSNRMQRYRIVSETKTAAVAKARTEAGVGAEVETETEQRLEDVDFVLE